MQQKPGRTMARPVRAKARPLILAMLLGLALPGAGHAFGFGHARLLSAPGQPLRVEVPVTQLAPDELGSLQVSLAPADAWSQAGLVPPVALDSLQVALGEGAVSGTRVARLMSSQPFAGAVADILLDVRTATGQQRHQVSLLAQPGSPQVLAASVAPVGGGAGAQPAIAGAAGDTITIQRGDTLFSIARKHAVSGVSLYQLMIALYQANPQAFIDGNLNLIKAGATLRIPDASTLTAISDAEARRLFVQHARAFSGGRQRVAANATAAPVDAAPSDRGQISANQASIAPAPEAASRDQLKLSESRSASSAADVQVAAEKGLQESQSRVSELEDNVRQLSAALQSQGAAAHGAQAPAGAAAQGTGQGAGSALPATNAQAQLAGAAASAASAQGEGAGVQGAAGGGSGADTAGGAAGSPSAGNASQGGSSAQVAQNGDQAGTGNAGVAGAQPAASAQSGASAAPAAAAGAATASSPAVSAESAAGASQSSTDGFSGKTWAAIIGLLALLVLIVVWLLRRGNPRSDKPEEGAPVTGAMIQHKLGYIDLDLQRPASDTHNDRA